MNGQTKPSGTPESAVQQHIACVECGYDLYMQPGDGVCPECKTPIGESIAHSKYLYGDAKGTALASVALAAVCVFGTIGMVMGYTLGSAYLTQVSFSIAVFAFITS